MIAGVPNEGGQAGQVNQLAPTSAGWGTMWSVDVMASRQGEGSVGMLVIMAMLEVQG